MADKPPDSFIVRILGPGGHPVGIGALVGRREIITCAHVVNAALGLDSRVQAQPLGVVTVEFPLVSDQAIPPLRLDARVEKWLPPPREGAAGDDVAGLVLTAEQAPAGTAAARLIVNMPPTGTAVRVFGYPGSPPRPDGAWV